MEGIISRQFISFLSITSICVLVGVPIWWKTTEVYRSPLPYEQINELKTQESSSLPLCTIDIISIITNTDGLSLSKTINNTISVAGSQYHTSCTVKLTDKSDDLHDMNSIYRHITNNYINETNHSIGRYIIYVVPQGSIENGSMFISNKRHAMVEYIDERQLQKDVTDITDVFCGLKSRAKSSNNKCGQKRVKIAQGYNINIILVNSDPLSMMARWNIETATDDILLPFLQHKGVSNIAQYFITSQIFYYTDVNLKTTYNEQFSSFQSQSKHIPTMISNIEAKLGSFVSQWPNLNFIIYIPRHDEYPLYIVDKKGGPAGVDSFFVPQWGGVIIHNPSPSSLNESHLSVNMETAMPTIIKQLKLLLGLNTEDTLSCGMESSQHYCLSHWDIDNLLMLLTIEKLTLAKNSLISLVELLDDVKNMVISDHIQQEVVESLNQINQCRERMMTMDWESAHIAADKAFHHAETAFFDPSILALLYFPDDQKYAIYVPLFVPISIPILRSLIKFIRSMKRT